MAAAAAAAGVAAVPESEGLSSSVASGTALKERKHSTPDDERHLCRMLKWPAALMRRYDSVAAPSTRVHAIMLRAGYENTWLSEHSKARNTVPPATKSTAAVFVSDTAVMRS